MTPHKYIPSIDGLRALAVLAVILFHGFPQVFPGGFIGVDVFFVISGYLITQIIVTQATSNQFSFVEFYSRRIRRIFPTLILVFIVVYGLGWFVMLPSEFMQLGKHILAGASFVSNWVYWLEAGYFDELAELKPLLNLWSLGVEEQFYIFWPCIILLLMRMKFSLRNMLIGLIVLSFLVNILFVRPYPSATFYLPFARTWELGLGGLIAIYYSSTRVKRFNNLIAMLGLAGILAPIFYLSPQSVFPGWLVLPPVLGTALLLAVAQSDILPMKFFSTSWVVALGLISYPLYLWHWPVLSFGRLMKGASLSAIETIFLLFISLILAHISYMLIEKRIRYLGKKIVIALCLLMVGIGFQGWNTYHREGLEHRLTKNIQIPIDQKQDFVKWERKGMLPTGNCEPGFIYPEAHVCAQSNGSQDADIIVIGDSHAFSAYWGIAKAYGDQHVVRLVGQGACLPFLDAGEFGQYPSCKENINKQIDWIAHNPSVKTVFIFHRNRDITSTTIRESFELSVNETFNKLQQAKKRVIYSYVLPELNFEPRLCVGELPLGRKNPLDSCAYPLDRELDKQSGYRSSMKNVLMKHPDVRAYDPAIFLCPNGICNAVIDGKVMFTDSNHLSESGSNMQGAAIKKQYPLN
ncbi:acyltransferase [Polynucleobacter sp. es-GGE-1]|jgi:peptidoglycan/LPS O-acetylase OafA/YrhL|uniref:acyltransferase family protein n=1 Tax=Polynucleobacter sp. es-GGE-1 TaxID=1819724 RepID=UPI001C0C0FA1|nr:acyltransferase family protein [Polynucleobacter sp. es-GGE-1]MBU3635460.1 acyltransferase [Polynucleobacter sp. es-GGE-1]